MTMIKLTAGPDPEDKQKRIQRLMECTKEEITTQWVTVGTEMKENYDNLKMEFIEYKNANDISRFFEDINQKNLIQYPGSKLKLHSG